MTDDAEVVARAELLPCPFCGGEATMESACLVRDTYWWATCRNERCTVKCHGFQALKQADAITAWNTRAAMSADPRVKVLEEALEWYGEQARLARLIHSEGDAGRHALAADGGTRARTALSRSRGAAS